ncbi:hypothetical protein A1Q1_07602 [Trichosporon asahii var. asahii CBS 2479]|uniref:Uncharacterized protein n=1 Tax=Trichosporon asahii var. asahii (strain ATCC 90039 / CBS 2479 / JCM 2466 / KCTC 7840 / NBRC 103889/ NCYC 2677 / UAMH 7654) TaxID=1186058 RepID=J5R7R0_TRIAS|nr:hypothetical protein A1Q1_07602 [Trichosporon asahii var. asahii CBS 2479]EJT51138.1 hypothetical protein A1Q1_07602 [Trichosporon asahii var. asahii CBS 2479]
MGPTRAQRYSQMLLSSGSAAGAGTFKDAGLRCVQPQNPRRISQRTAGTGRPNTSHCPPSISSPQQITRLSTLPMTNHSTVNIANDKPRAQQLLDPSTVVAPADEQTMTKQTRARQKQLSKSQPLSGRQRQQKEEASQPKGQRTNKDEDIDDIRNRIVARVKSRMEHRKATGHTVTVEDVKREIEREMNAEDFQAHMCASIKRQLEGLKVQLMAEDVNRDKDKGPALDGPRRQPTSRRWF